jgi:hypothetical protein
MRETPSFQLRSKEDPHCRHAGGRLAGVQTESIERHPVFRGDDEVNVLQTFSKPS